MRTFWKGGDGQGLREAGQRLEMSVIGMPLDESTPSEYQRVFGEIAKERPDAIMTHDIGEVTTYHQLMLTLSKKAVCRRFMACLNTRKRVGCWPMRPTSATLRDAWLMI
jgi:hypothetical protein